MITPSSEPRASEAAEQLVKRLNVAYKAVRLYPPTSAIPRDSASTVIATLRAMLREDPDVSLTVTKEGLFHADAAVFPGQPAFLEFSREFFSRHLAEVRFHSGVTVTEVIEFLRVLDVPVNELIAAGGFEARLWAGEVVNVTVREATTRIVDHVEVTGEDAEDEPLPDARTIDDILAEVSAGRPRDQVVLVRLVASPDALASYLQESLRGRGTTPPATWLTSRVSSLATAVAGESEADRVVRLEALAGGLMELDEAALRDVLMERMLPEARHDERLAEIVKHLGVERLCNVLAAGFEDTDESREGLTRAFRNLLNITDLGRDQVLGACGGAMQAAGIDDEVASDVLRGVLPTQISTGEPRRSVESTPIEKIVRLVDLAPVGTPMGDSDPDRDALAQEAREGIGDGDVLGALVGLITIEQRDEQFNSLMSVVEDGLSLLITRQEYRVAATVTDALSEAAEDEARPEPQRERIAGALDSLASKPNTRAIAAAMRRHSPETDEHRACRHLLTVLGRHAIQPLLEVLADEPDMTARKALVSLISEMAEEHVEELGAHLADERWYFVRNIVTILGSTRTDTTLQLLGRTLRYPDPRVRRETIRAVSGIRDALTGEMLIAGLADPDAQNVQLAARYLGLLHNASAAGALEEVALGRGTGSRDTAARVEAIEALGRVSSASSLPMLRALTKTRGIRGRAQARELASAAEAAVAAIERTTSKKADS